MSRATARPQRQGAAQSLGSRIRIPIRIRLAVAILSIAPMWILPPNTWAVACCSCLLSFYYFLGFFFVYLAFFVTEVTAETRARNWHTHERTHTHRDTYTYTLRGFQPGPGKRPVNWVKRDDGGCILLRNRLTARTQTQSPRNARTPTLN